MNRVLAEQQAGRYLVDSMQGGVSTVIARMIPAGALSPVADLFIHPEVIDKSLWFNGTHWYSDPDQKFIFAFSAVLNPMNMGMRYNTDLVSQEDLDAVNASNTDVADISIRRHVTLFQRFRRCAGGAWRQPASGKKFNSMVTPSGSLMKNCTISSLGTTRSLKSTP